MKCPKCGTENNDSSKFCYECGTEIVSEQFLCPKCGTRVCKHEKFCTNCGNKFSWVDVDYDTIPIPLTSNGRKASQSPKKKAPSNHKFNIFHHLICGLLIGAFLLVFIGCFGALSAVRVSASGSVSSYTLKLYASANISSLSYYFRDIFESLSVAPPKGQVPFSYAFPKTLLVIDLITYYLLFAYVIFALTFVITNVVLSYIKGSKINKIVPLVGLILIVARVCVVNSMYTIYLTQYIRQVLGWGSVLILIGCLLLFCVFVLDPYKQAFEEKASPRKYLQCSLITLTKIFIFVLIILIFKHIVVIEEQVSYSETLKLKSSGYNVLVMCAQMVDSFADSEVHLATEAVGNYLIWVSAILMGVNAIFIKKSSLIDIIFHSVGVLISIIGFILFFSGLNSFIDTDVKIGPTAGTVFIFILSGLSIAALIVSRILRGNEE